MQNWALVFPAICGFLTLVLGSWREPMGRGLLVNQTELAPNQFTNPLRPKDGSDPFIVYHDGFYYFMSTTWKDVQLTRSRTLNGLKNGEKKVVYKDNTPRRCCNVWAPEIHEVDGSWYIYFTAGDQKDLGLQRSHVLKGGPSPWGSYTYAGVLANEWGIDGTVAVIQKKRYYIFSCQRDKMQSLCIAPMLSAVKLGPIHLLSQPTLPWERAEGKTPVNEGPAVMENKGRYFMAYSASFCWTASYSLGLLTLKDGADPLQRSSWAKSGPVLRSANGNFGPGHNGFFKSPDGKEWWNVFHATAKTTGTCNGDRYTMAEAMEWDANGNPRFDRPPPLSSSLRAPSGDGAAA